jgi:hypothetical protein
MADNFFCREDDYSREELDEIFRPLFDKEKFGFYTYKQAVTPTVDHLGCKQGKEVLLSKNNALEQFYLDGYIHGTQISAYRNGNLFANTYHRGVR